MLQIKANPEPGDNLNIVCEEALHIAKTLNARIIIRFNNVLLKIRSDSSIAETIESYEKELEYHYKKKRRI